MRLLRTSGAMLAAGLASISFAGTAEADVPPEFIGKWTSAPPRCEPETGEVDILDVDKKGFGFYEIDCAINRSTRAANSVTFAATCAKGGIPASPGTVVFRRLPPDKIGVVFRGFSWITTEPLVFHRCKAP